MSNKQITLVFVHGWSVTSMDTYGELPLGLREEGKKNGLEFDIREIFLGRYISFHDEVRLHDIARAFEVAVREQLAEIVAQGRRFVCITHSTGGPVIRDWWHTYYKEKGGCPMSHLIMLAPANHGSALAQIGKARLGRLKSWFSGTEPGQGVLDWLELGSREGWELNLDWVRQTETAIGPQGIFPFVLTGQTIDRKLYDNLNTYTGETGSDGVVRAASASINTRYVQLTQPPVTKDRQGRPVPKEFTFSDINTAPKTAFRLIRGKSHSGEEMGIMRSVKKDPGSWMLDAGGRDTVESILACLRVQTKKDYSGLIAAFEQENDLIWKEELLEKERELMVFRRYFIRDRFSMVVFRVRDHEGRPVSDFDLILTAGDNDDPNHFPEGFCQDRQRNRLNPETITFFFNYDVLNGSGPVKDGTKVVRPAIEPTTKLGLQVIPRPDNGFVRYLPCRITASSKMFSKVLFPHATTLVDIVLQRLVDKEVFRVEEMDPEGALLGKSFKNLVPGGEIV